MSSLRSQACHNAIKGGSDTIDDDANLEEEPALKTNSLDDLEPSSDNKSNTITESMLLIKRNVAKQRYSVF